MVIDGVACRFCFKCGTWQKVELFDGIRTSCREQLLLHNARQRYRRNLHRFKRNRDSGGSSGAEEEDEVEEEEEVGRYATSSEANEAAEMSATVLSLQELGQQSGSDAAVAAAAALAAAAAGTAPTAAPIAAMPSHAVANSDALAALLSHLQPHPPTIKSESLFGGEQPPNTAFSLPPSTVPPPASFALPAPPADLAMLDLLCKCLAQPNSIDPNLLQLLIHIIQQN